MHFQGATWSRSTYLPVELSDWYASQEGKMKITSALMMNMEVHF